LTDTARVTPVVPIKTVLMTAAVSSRTEKKNLSDIL
jgi:hypothetical protein